MVLRLPWVKGAPTHPDFVAKASHDFTEQRDRCLALIQQFSAQPLESLTAPHPAFGAMTGRESSQLQAKHLDHHLKQFSV